MPPRAEPWAPGTSPRDLWRARLPAVGRWPPWGRPGHGALQIQLLQPWYGPILLILAVSAYLFGGTVPTGLAVLWAAAGLVDTLWASLAVLATGAEAVLPAGPFTAGQDIPVDLVLSRPRWLLSVPAAWPDGLSDLRRLEPADGTADGPADGTASDGADGPADGLADGPAHGGAEGPADGRAEGPADGTAPRPAGGSRRVTVLRTILRALRGRRRVGPFLIGVAGPCGIVEARRRVRPGPEILVLPRLHRLPPWPAGRGGSRRRGPAGGADSVDPGSVLGIRPLVSGDPLRRVHWKRSAATATWQVKRLDMEPARKAAVVLDLAAAAYAAADRSITDRAVELAAATAAALASRGHSDAVWLYATGRRPVEVRASARAQGARPLLEALAEAESNGPTPLGGWLREHTERVLPGGGSLVVVTAAPVPEWIGPLLAARRGGVEPAALLLLGSPAERGPALEACRALQRAGVAAWAVTGPEDLAAQLALGGGRAPGRRVGA